MLATALRLGTLLDVYAADIAPSTICQPYATIALLARTWWRWSPTDVCFGRSMDIHLYHYSPTVCGTPAAMTTFRVDGSIVKPDDGDQFFANSEELAGSLPLLWWLTRSGYEMNGSEDPLPTL